MSTNDITGARLVTPAASKEYLDNYDAIFRQKRKSAVLTEIEYQKLLDESELEYLKSRCGGTCGCSD